MLGVQLPPDTGAEGVHRQALGQAAQELHRGQERLLGPGAAGGAQHHPCNTPILRDGEILPRPQKSLRGRKGEAAAPKLEPELEGPLSNKRQDITDQPHLNVESFQFSPCEGGA